MKKIGTSSQRKWVRVRVIRMKRIGTSLQIESATTTIDAIHFGVSTFFLPKSPGTIATSVFHFKAQILNPSPSTNSSTSDVNFMARSTTS